MLIGYVRVSTEEQNEQRQITLLQQHNVEKYFIDKASGKNTNRPQFQQMLSFCRQGDTIIVESFSRFARNTKDLLETVEFLTSKQVEFVSLKENVDTTTPQGKLMLTLFGALSEFEREQILERQREGIAIAKAQGKYKGKPRKEIDRTQFEKVCTQWRSGSITARKAMELLNLKPNTFYRRIKEWKL